MSDIENKPTPFHIEPMEKGSLLHTGELTSLVAQPGDHLRDLTVKVRGLVSRGYLHPVGRDKNDARGALLFDPTAAVAAAALLAASDAGLSGTEKFDRLAGALQVWHGQTTEQGEPKNPAAFMLLTQIQSDVPHGFSVELHTSRSIVTGKPDYWAGVSHADHGYLGSNVVLVQPNHVPVAALVIPLDTHLSTIVANMEARDRKRAAN